MKKIAILGTGVVGQSLASGFLKHGYEVVFGTMHPDKTIEWKHPEVSTAPITTYRQAVEPADAVVLAVKGTASEAVIKEIAPLLKNKIVIDATNPIADAQPENGVLKYFTTLEDSLMERLQRIAPDALFVKAFNTIGNAYFVNPDFGGIKPTMFICGNNEAAKQEVTAMLDQFGFAAEDMGTATSARAIEPLCILWCIPGLLKNDWSARAFKLLK